MEESFQEKGITVRFRGETYLNLFKRVEEFSDRKDISLNSALLRVIAEGIRALEQEGGVATAPAAPPQCEGLPEMRQISSGLVDMHERSQKGFDEIREALERLGMLTDRLYLDLLSRTYQPDGPLKDKLRADAERTRNDVLAKIDAEIDRFKEKG